MNTMSPEQLVTAVKGIANAGRAAACKKEIAAIRESVIISVNAIRQICALKYPQAATVVYAWSDDDLNFLRFENVYDSTGNGAALITDEMEDDLADLAPFQHESAPNWIEPVDGLTTDGTTITITVNQEA